LRIRHSRSRDGMRVLLLFNMLCLLDALEGRTF
jgi:hypothetical protein